MSKTRVEGRAAAVTPRRAPSVERKEAKPARRSTAAAVAEEPGKIAEEPGEQGCAQDGFDAAKAIVRHQNELKAQAEAAEEAKETATKQQARARQAAAATTEALASAVYGQLEALEPQCHDLEAMLGTAAKVEGRKSENPVRISLLELEKIADSCDKCLDLTKDGFQISVHDYRDNVYPKEDQVPLREMKPGRLLSGKSPMVPRDDLAAVDVEKLQARLVEERAKLATVVKTGVIPAEWIGRMNSPGGGG
jgi:hypothetical protein